jgi:AraC-like DNA-binding protein
MPDLGSTPFRHALPVPDRLFNEPIYLTHAGWERIGPGQPYPLAENQLYSFDYAAGRSLPEFTLCLVAEGAGDLEVAGNSQALSCGDAFFYVPCQWHRHRPLQDTGWTLYWIHFNGSLPHTWLKENAYLLDGSKPLIELPSLYQAQFERLLLAAHRSPTANSRELSWQAIGLISHLITDPNRDSELSAYHTNEVASLAIEYIWNHTHAEVDIGTLAGRLNISRRTLERHFRKSTGRSLLEEIQNCRVARARRLLVETDIPIKEIVFRAGFNTREQLRQAFAKVFGQSPDSFRRQNSEPDGS